MPAVSLNRSSYSPSSVSVGIVHIGLGAFHRAHQAVYIERWLNRNGGGPWGICAANIRSNQAVVDQLIRQDCRFHVAAYSDSQHLRLDEIHSIRRAIYAAADKEALFAQLVAPTTRIVSLTVTEKAYGLNPATGELGTESPEIAHDIEQADRPRTVPGLLCEALRRRRSAGTAPFTILSCDNMPDNGVRTKHALATLAMLQSNEFGAWIDANVACPSSMVDRIVPAATAESMRELTALLGFPDPAAIACESFSQWVIEDCFPSGRPDWERDGVEMVANVKPFETMKLRLLNGAHSLLAYVGLARGYTTVAQAIADPAMLSLVRDFFEEASASLDRTAIGDIDGYTSALLARFRNDALNHRLSQIAMDGSQKIPQRWLDAALINLERGRGIDATATALAAWIAHVRGTDGRRQEWPVNDPLAPQLRRCHESSDAAQAVDSILAIREVFSERLAVRDDFRTAVRRACQEALR